MEAEGGSELIKQAIARGVWAHEMRRLGYPKAANQQSNLAGELLTRFAKTRLAARDA